MNYDLTLANGLPARDDERGPLHMVNYSSWDTAGLLVLMRWFSQTMIENRARVYPPQGDEGLPCVVVFVDQKRSRTKKKYSRYENPLVEGRTAIRMGDAVVVIALQHPAHLTEQGVVEQLVMQNEPLEPMSTDMMTELINVLQSCVGSLQLWVKSASTSQYGILSVLCIGANEKPLRKKPKVLGQILAAQATKRAVRLARSRCYDATREYMSARRHMATAVRHCSSSQKATLSKQLESVASSSAAAAALMDTMMDDIKNLNAQIVSMLNGGNDAQI